MRADELSIPLENLISPELVRRICWQPPETTVAEALVAMGARRWQSEIAAPILEAALLEKEPLEIEETSDLEATDEKSGPRCCKYTFCPTINSAGPATRALIGVAV